MCGGQLVHPSSTPDAAFFFADRFVAVDHQLNEIYCVAVYLLNRHDLCDDTERWTSATLEQISCFLQQEVPRPEPCCQGGGGQHMSFSLHRSPSQYAADVHRCLELLHAGESYEICLTNRYQKKRVRGSDRELYRHLRRRNPAPYGAWLKFGTGVASLTICCSSPERFLRGERDRTLEAKPIKGTSARSMDPLIDRASKTALQNSEKDQAENLMIVDLLRNDLGRICEVFSVTVPSLMEVPIHTCLDTMHALLVPYRWSLLRRYISW